jgi:glycosyltransferase involved in cell wall biosynthesis
MTPLLLNTYDAQGGAGIATYRIHRALWSIGIETRLMVQSSKRDVVGVDGPVGWQRLSARLRPHIDNIPNRFFRKSKPEHFSVAWLPGDVLARIEKINPDLVHLFWVNNGFIRLENLGRISQPSVWTLHDMWPFTGGCHYDDACGRFTEHCGRCPSIYSESNHDISHHTFKRKLNAWKNWDVTIVATSDWLAKEARSSTLFRDRDIRVIPNAIDIDTYKPISKSIARSIFNLPSNKRIVMFSAFSATSHPRKGGHLLMTAVEQIARTNAAADIELIVVGASAPKQPKDFGIPVHYMGNFDDEISQVVLYSAADVLVAPSMQENLSNTVMEALACGTPVVAFQIGGMPDMVEHQANGYLAQAFDSNDLAQGILWVLDTDDRLEKLSARARASVVETFSFPLIAGRYDALYRELLGVRSKV